MALFLIAVAAYAPGISYGLPTVQGPEDTQSWLADEMGSDMAIRNLREQLRNRAAGNRQYPLLHSLVLGAAYTPYFLWQRASGGVPDLSAGYPYGFVDPVEGIHTLTLLSRFVTVLMAAGVVVAAYFIGSTLWGSQAGVLAGLFVVVMYPMSFYGRTSNVDVPALFWASLALLAFARIVARGITTWRVVMFGCLAALSVATKDQNYAVLIPFMVPVFLFWLRRDGAGESSTPARRWAPLAGAFLLSVVVYASTSGLLLNPNGFITHVRYITGEGGGYYTFAASPSGYAALLGETLRLVAWSVSWPVFLAALAGIAISLRRRDPASWLLLVLPGLYLFALVPIRNVLLRFVMAVAFVFACFAAYAVSRLFEREGRRWVGLAVAAVLLLLALPRSVEVSAIMVTGGARQDASTWLSEHARPGDRVEFFGWPGRNNFMPHVPSGATLFVSETVQEPGGRGPEGDFVVLLGLLDLYPDSLPYWPSRPPGAPEWVRQGLADGSLGYELGTRIDARTRFSHEDFGVHPPIEIYVRRDRVEP